MNELVFTEMPATRKMIRRDWFWRFHYRLRAKIARWQALAIYRIQRAKNNPKIHKIEIH